MCRYYLFVCNVNSYFRTFPFPTGPHFAEYLHWDVTEECEVRLVCKVRGQQALPVPHREAG